jgi:hypothetical protein
MTGFDRNIFVAGRTSCMHFMKFFAMTYIHFVHNSFTCWAHDLQF